MKKKNNPKELSKLIKSVISTTGPTTTNCFTSNVSVNGDVVDNPIEICERSNNYFVNIGHDHGRRLRVCGHAVHAHTFGYIMKNTRTLLKFFLGLNNITFC